MVELAQAGAQLGLLGKLGPDADAGEAVEDPELLFAQAFVDVDASVGGAAAPLADCLL